MWALGEEGEGNIQDILTHNKDGSLSLVQSKGHVTWIHCHSQGYLQSGGGGGGGEWCC